MQLFLNERCVTGKVYELEQPLQETECCDGCDENQPKPDEDEDFLVEEVDGKNTLHCVAVDVAQLTHLSIKNLRKTSQLN